MKYMRYGLSFLPDATNDVKSASQYYRDALQLSLLADEVGFHLVKMTEHYLHPYGGYCPSPVVFLSAVAACTKRVRLLTGGILPVFHHPIQLAAQASMLDAISNGRAEIGFSRAYLPYEFDAFQVNLDGSRERFIATIDAVIQLWREPNTTIQSEFFAFRNVTSFPSCTQLPHPPVWVAAVQSRQSFAWIGKRGYKLLITPGVRGYEDLGSLLTVYRECFAEDHPTDTAEVAISLPVFVSPSDKDAIERGDYYLARYLRVWADAAKAWNSRTSTDYPRYTGFGQGLKSDSPASMRRRGAALIGCPERVLEELYSLKSQLEIDALLLQIDFGAMPGVEARKSLEVFIDRVMPKIPSGCLLS